MHFTHHVRQTMQQYTIGDGEDIVVDTRRSHGSWLVAAGTGRPYLDCSSQFASQPLGWNHPRLVESARRLGRVALHKVANSDFYTRELGDFVAAFAGIAPDFQHFFFIEGGTLGVENALKAAFDWKSKKLGLTDDGNPVMDVIHLKEAFHGRSGYTLSLTNTSPGKTSLFPKFPWTRIPNPKLKFPVVEQESALEAESLDLAEFALRSRPVAAIILETIQGEGGDNHFSPGYLHGLRDLATKYDAMLILDEVQTGVGLTGQMWAYQHFGIVPDMISFGKKSQVCGFCSTTRIDGVPNNVFRESGRINSTWGGNIVDMVRATIIFDVIRKECLVGNAAATGEYFLGKLLELPRISNVRGRGLMIAFDVEDRDQVLRNLRKTMTVLPCGQGSIRLRPHLTFSRGDADIAVEFIRQAVS
jgi:L-lysine 6-transaminase